MAHFFREALFLHNYTDLTYHSSRLYFESQNALFNAFRTDAVNSSTVIF